MKNRLYNNPCTKEKRGGSTLEKSIKVYGNISISGGIEDGRLEKFPINLQYYKIHNNIENNNMKTYGIGIVKTQQDEIETIMEKSEFSNIFIKEQEADNMLKMLIKNKVTPISLRYILEDLILV